MLSVVRCKVSQPSLLKRKSSDGKFVTAKFSNINDGATLKGPVLVAWRLDKRQGGD